MASNSWNKSVLDESVIKELPDAAYYVPNFVDDLEEQHLLTQIRKTPISRWTQLSRRRLLSLPSTLAGPARDTLLAASLPAYLENPLLPRFVALGLFADSPHRAPNHVLVNEYEPGQGIMPHEDGPAYYPITATVSLGSHTVLEVYRKTAQGEREPEPIWRVLQEPRSLLVTMGEMYRVTLHGIAEREADEQLGPDTVINWNMLGEPAAYVSGTVSRQTRISLTYRDVLKVAKIGGAMKFISKK